MIGLSHFLFGIVVLLHMTIAFAELSRLTEFGGVITQGLDIFIGS